MERKMKVKLEGVQETLLIPLVLRAMETQSENSRIIDKNAVDIVNKIDYDFSKFKKRGSYQGVIARTLILDRETQHFIDTYENCICISVGCGLDTRYQRIRHKKVTWYNLDFPNVIDLRRKLLYEDKNVKFIKKSALDISWTDEVEEKDRPTLIILEGILMYFDEVEVMQLFSMLRNHFPECTILAEIMHPFIAGKSKYHDTVKSTSAVFKWGIETGKQMEKMCEGIQFIKEWNLFDELTDQGFLYKIAGKVPFIRNKNNKIVMFRME